MKDQDGVRQTTINTFRRSLLSQQAKQNKVPKDATRSLVSTLIFVGLLVVIEVALLFAALSLGRGGSERDRAAYFGFFGFAIVFMGIALLGGLVRLFLLLPKFFQSKRTITCPRCNTEHKLWRSVRFYGCPTCLCPMFIGRNHSKLLELPCPYCQHLFASDSNHGSLRCPNCGTILNVKDGVAQAEYGESNNVCFGCKAVMPVGAYICRACNTLSPIYDPLSTDSSVESMLARDRFGLTAHVRSLQTQMRTLLKAQTAEYYMNLIINLTKMMNLLVESELTDENCNLTEISSIVREVDHLYAKCLFRTYDGIQYSLKKTSYLKQGAVSSLIVAPQVSIRLQLHTVLTKVRTEQGAETVDLGFPNWQLPLPASSWPSATWVGDDFSVRIIEPSPLKQEALRIWPTITSERY